MAVEMDEEGAEINQKHSHSRPGWLNEEIISVLKLLDLPGMPKTYIIWLFMKTLIIRHVMVVFKLLDCMLKLWCHIEIQQAAWQVAC